jgi:hypothetical protein
VLRITDEEAYSVNTTNISNEGKLEENLRKWILDEPAEILGEDLRIIGREVTLNESGDAVDLLAIDSDGNIVVIELKKGTIGRSVDFQALKYAAYTSGWGQSELEEQFEEYKQRPGSEYDNALSFGGLLDKFANKDYDINKDQRLIIVGEATGDRFKQVSEWLEQKGIDITVIEVQLYEDDKNIYLTTDRIVASNSRDTSYDQTASQAWKRDGQKWHLNKMNKETGEMLNEIVSKLDNIKKLNGPHWGQRHYISFGIGTDTRRNRVVLKTQATLFHIRINSVSVDVVDKESLAANIGVSTENVEIAQNSNRSGDISVTCYEEADVNEQAIADVVEKVVE